MILTNDHLDLYNKFEIILNRCCERRVILKFAKSDLGFDIIDFFGYRCKAGSYEMSPDRKTAISTIPMPMDSKAMQRILGSGIFFQGLVPDYSNLTALLHDMTTAVFSWDRATWTHDYVAVFEKFKTALVNSVELDYPDYELEWMLTSDASLIACACVLV